MSYFTWYELMRRQQNPEVPPVSPVIVQGIIGISNAGVVIAWEELTNTGFEPETELTSVGQYTIINTPAEARIWCFGSYRSLGNPLDQVELQLTGAQAQFVVTRDGVLADTLIDGMTVELQFWPPPIV